MTETNVTRQLHLRVNSGTMGCDAGFSILPPFSRLANLSGPVLTIPRSRARIDLPCKNRASLSARHLSCRTLSGIRSSVNGGRERGDTNDNGGGSCHGRSDALCDWRSQSVHRSAARLKERKKPTASGVHTTQVVLVECPSERASGWNYCSPETLVKFERV